MHKRSYFLAYSHPFQWQGFGCVTTYACVFIKLIGMTSVNMIRWVSMLQDLNIILWDTTQSQIFSNHHILGPLSPLFPISVCFNCQIHTPI